MHLAVTCREPPIRDLRKYHLEISDLRCPAHFRVQRLIEAPLAAQVFSLIASTSVVDQIGGERRSRSPDASVRIAFEAVLRPAQFTLHGNWWVTDGIEPLAAKGSGLQPDAGPSSLTCATHCSRSPYGEPIIRTDSIRMPGEFWRSATVSIRKPFGPKPLPTVATPRVVHTPVLVPTGGLEPP